MHSKEVEESATKSLDCWLGVSECALMLACDGVGTVSKKAIMQESDSCRSEWKIT